MNNENQKIGLAWDFVRWIDRNIWTLIVLCGIVFMWVTFEFYNPEVENKPSSKATVQPIIDKKQSNVDSLLAIILNRLKGLESSKNAAQTIRIDLGKAYQQSVQDAPDTCKFYINSIYKDCNRLDSTNKVIIHKQDSSLSDYSKTVGEQADIISLTRYQLQNARDSVYYLYEEIHPKGKKKFIRIINKAGEKILIFLAGVGAGKAIP